MENYTPIDLKSSPGLWNKKAAIAGGTILVIALLIFFVRLATQNRTTTQSSAAGNCPLGYDEVPIGSCPSLANPTPAGGDGTTECCLINPTPGGSCPIGTVPGSAGVPCAGGGNPSVQCNGDNQCSYCCPETPTATPTDPPIDTPTPTPTDTPTPTPTGTLIPTPTCFVPMPSLTISCPNGCNVVTPTP